MIYPQTSGEIAQLQKPGTSAEVGFVEVGVLESRGYYAAATVTRARKKYVDDVMEKKVIIVENRGILSADKTVKR